MAENGMEQIKTLKSQMVSVMQAAVANGVENIDACELGVVADIIKDLAETEMLCQKAKYYESVAEAMEDYEEEDGEQPVYDPYYPYGYRRPKRPMIGRMGYNDWPDRRDIWADNRTWTADPETNRYGRAYSEYRKARRNYTDTHNENDKKDMDMMAERHVMNAMESLKDIWNEADPMLKTKMKSDMAKLVEEMKM